MTKQNELDLFLIKYNQKTINRRTKSFVRVCQSALSKCTCQAAEDVSNAMPIFADLAAAKRANNTG